MLRLIISLSGFHNLSLFYKYLFIPYVLLGFFTTTLNGQAAETNLRSQNSINTQTTLPSSPEAASLGEYGNFPVSPYTGTANISVPVYSIKGNRIGLDVNINYQTGGVKVEDRGSGSLGIGWALNAGGSITRSVKGAPDMHYNYYDNAHVFEDYFLQEPLSFDSYDFFYRTVNGYYETQPDTYFYAFNGRSGKFHIAADKRIIQTEDSDLKIEPFFGEAYSTLGIMEEFTILTKFIITDESGTKYYYEDAEYSVLRYDDVTALAMAAFRSHEYNSTWHLTKIESHDGLESIEFSYTESPTNYTPPYNLENFRYRNFIVGLTKDSPCTINENTSGTVGEGGLNLHYIINRRFLDEIVCKVNGESREKLVFEFTPNTCNDSVDGDDTDLRLNDIKIFTGENASNHTLTHHFSYFACMEDRLFLKDTGIRPAGESSYNLQPPYEFEYHATTLPSFTSFAQDKWGFYNGKGNSSLIPGSSVPGITYAGADRSSSGTFAVARSLTKVTYPTGGYTSYNYEGNLIPNPSSSLVLNDCTFPCPIFESCKEDLSDCEAASCVDLTERVYLGLGFTNQVIDDGYFIIRSDSICGSGIIQRSNGWSGSASISIINNSTGMSVGEYNESFDVNPWIDTIKINDEFNLQAGVQYSLIIKGSNTRTTATTKIGVFNPEPPIAIGGVRLKSIKHYDRNNVFLKGRKYAYVKNSSESSGIIVQEPRFEEIGSYTFNSPNMYGGCNPSTDCCDYMYTSVRLTASPSFPLGSFDGSFYGYSRVEEIDLLNNSETQIEGKRVYHFYNNRKTGTDVDVIENGKLTKLEIFDANGLVVKRELNEYAFDIGENQREESFYGFKVESEPAQDNKNKLVLLNDGSYVWTQNTASLTNEVSRSTYDSKWERSSNDYMRLVNYSSFLTQKVVFHYYYDNSNQFSGEVSEIISYDYSTNLDYVQPSAATTVNSNNDIHRLEYEYPDSYSHGDEVKDSLISRNIILPAWRNKLYYNNNQIDGQETRFSFYSDFTGNDVDFATNLLYPEFAYRYESTWDIPIGVNTVGSFQAGAWDKQMEAKQYDKNCGKPIIVRRNHWPLDDSYEYDDVGNMLSHTYGIYTSSWTYHPETYLLDKQTAVDGTSRNHSYDDLLRPFMITDNNRGVETSFDYIYAATYNAVQTSTTYQKLGSQTRTLSDYVFKDDIGREYQTIRFAQGPTAGQSVVTGRTFDKVGRVQREYEPRAVANTTSPQSLSGDRTTFTYDGSPLNRQKKITDPEGWESTIDYRANESDEVDGYDSNQLYRIDQYDGNGTRTTVFTDKRGNQVLSRRYDIDENNTTILFDNYQYFDGKDRQTTIRPPGAQLSNTNLLFRKAYAGNDLLLYEFVPGKGRIDYVNSSRGQLIHRQDPLMKFHGTNLHYTMRYDDYGNLIQEGWQSNTSNIPANDVATNGVVQILCAIHNYGTENNRAKGKVTTSAYDQITSKVSGSNNGPPRFTSHFSYNDAGLLSKKEFNHPLSTGDKSLKEEYVYDSADNQIQIVFDYTMIGSDPIKYNFSTEIDHANRIKESWYGQDDRRQKQLGAYSYTAKDLVEELVVGTDVQTIDYTYLKNRLVKEQSSDDFTSTLYYDNNNAQGFGQATRMNGDISGWSWNNNGDIQSYAYTYDGLDRLTFSSNDDNVEGAWSSNYSYDKRGNLMHLSRRNGDGDHIDSLVYVYTSGNRISSITDRAPVSLANEGYNGVAPRSYGYDANGNISSDQSRTTTTTYNHMDLPFEIAQNSSNKIRYNYDFGGTLLNIVQTDGGAQTTTHYIGNIEYEGNTIKRINHKHGFFELGDFSSPFGLLSGNQSINIDECHEEILSFESVRDPAIVNYFATECIELRYPFNVELGAEFLADFKPYGKETFYWTLKDHKDNVRTILDDDGAVLQELNMYPFNLRHDYNNDPDYEWNSSGSLEQKAFLKHLDVLTYRTCDRTIARFLSVDLYSPTMTSWNGYNMNFGSPINYIDPTGLMPEATDEQREVFNKAKNLATVLYKSIDPPTPSSGGWTGKFYGSNYHVWTKGNIQIHQYWNGDNWLQETVNINQTGTGVGLSVNPNFNGNSEFSAAVSSIVYEALLPFLLLPMDAGFATVKTARTITVSRLASNGNRARKFWTKSTIFKNIKVFQRDDLIDPNLLDAAGRSNLQRMQKGLAPIGSDGKSLNLHHLTQRNSSSIAEMTQSFHQTNSKIIHINPNTIPSGINRSQFNSWRKSYWKNRAKDF